MHHLGCSAASYIKVAIFYSACISFMDNNHVSVDVQRCVQDFTSIPFVKMSALYQYCAPLFLPL